MWILGILRLNDCIVKPNGDRPSELTRSKWLPLIDGELRASALLKRTVQSAATNSAFRNLPGKLEFRDLESCSGLAVLAVKNLY